MRAKGWSFTGNGERDLESGFRRSSLPGTALVVKQKRLAKTARIPASCAPPKLTAPLASPEIKARAERLRRIQGVVASRTPTQRDADRRLFMSRLHGAERGDFERFGWMSPLNAEAIRAFWEDIHLGLFDRDDADA